MEKNNRNIIRRRVIKSYVTSVISISLVLVLLASAAIFVANAGNIESHFKENISFSVIFKQSTSENEATALSDKLAAKGFVKESRYVSKEDGTNEMKQLLGENFLDVFETSPIPISLELKLDARVVTKDSIEVIKKSILSDPLVEDVVYQENLVDAVNENLEKISAAIALVAVLLLAVSFTLISNTVRLNIHTRRFTIHTMRLVGAKNSFILRPFLLRAVLQGLVSGMISVLVMMAAMSRVRGKSEILASMFDTGTTACVLLSTVLAGVLICVVSTFMVVRKVAYMSKDELYY